MKPKTLKKNKDACQLPSIPRILIHGETGSGKTSMALQCIERGYKPILVNIEKRIGHLRKFYEFDYVDIDTPKDCLDFLTSITSITKSYDIIIVDSFTSLRELMQNVIIDERKDKSWFDITKMIFSQNDWGRIVNFEMQFYQKINEIKKPLILLSQAKYGEVDSETEIDNNGKIKSGDPVHALIPVMNRAVPFRLDFIFKLKIEGQNRLIEISKHPVSTQIGRKIKADFTFSADKKILELPPLKVKDIKGVA